MHLPPTESQGPRAASHAGLDDTVFPLRERLRAAEVPDPDVLFLMGTGVGFLPDRLVEARELELAEWSGEVEPWSAGVLHTGRLGTLSAWCLDDLSGEPLSGEPPPWQRALPVWLAAAAGAELLVHTSAGSALPGAGLSERCLALVSDHLNLSGASPLLGLGESRLGPLFPDLSRLHHAGLRRAALARAEALGLEVREAIAACTAGPALETPAERDMLARLGAQVAVPALATPMVAAGHAGLAALGLVAVTDAGAPATPVRHVVEAAAQLQPALEDLLLALVPDLAATVERLRQEAL